MNLERIFENILKESMIPFDSEKELNDYEEHLKVDDSEIESGGLYINRKSVRSLLRDCKNAGKDRDYARQVALAFMGQEVDMLLDIDYQS